MSAELDDLIIAASSGKGEDIAALAAKVKELDVSTLRESAGNFDFLFEAWNDSENYSADQTAFVLSLAGRDALDTQAFRNAMYETAKIMLPPYISSQAVLKMIGARDSSVQPHEVALRIAKLQKVPTGALVSFPDSKNWGRLSAVERVTATFSIQSLKSGTMNSFPVSIAFSSTLFFEPHQEMFGMILPGSALPPSAEYRKVFKHHCLTDISDEKLKDLVQAIVVPASIGMEAFEAWWSKEAPAAGQMAQRPPWAARSVLELRTLLNSCEGGVKLEEDQAQQLSAMFRKLRPNMTTKDADMLSECIAELAEANSDEIIKILFSSLKGIAPFWPASVENIAISKQLEVWGHLSVKALPAFIKATCQLYTPQETAKLACKLPSKCQQVLFFSIDMKEVAAAIFSDKNLSCDVLMTLWKSRTKFPKNLTSVVDMEHIAAALSNEGLPKEWASAQRDLKRALFEKDDFQKFVIDNADGDIPSIIDAIQKVRTFQSGECQSLMVKLARHSEELQAHIEKAGKKIMKKSGEPEAQVDQVPVTSHASLAKLVRELDDIINVQIPENVKAIAHARSYGDFRENAEYDAAKERRRFLHRRRNELENAVGTVQSTDFKGVVVNDYVVLGSMVTLTDKTGKDSVYYLLGAWDGDPERNRISYRTVMGIELMDKKVGSVVKLPNGEFTIKSVGPLPEELLKELADEKSGN